MARRPDTPDARRARARRSAANQRRDWKPAFLDAFRSTGMVTAACQAAGVSRATVYEQRQRDEAFALAWHDVEEETTEQMEAEARRRAVQGVDEPVFWRGEEVGAVRRYSDSLLMFMLKARRPEKYRERYDVNHSGRVDLAGVTPERLRAMSDEEIADLERRLASS